MLEWRSIKLSHNKVMTIRSLLRHAGIGAPTGTPVDGEGAFAYAYFIPIYRLPTG